MYARLHEIDISSSALYPEQEQAILPLHITRAYFSLPRTGYTTRMRIILLFSAIPKNVGEGGGDAEQL